MIWVMRGVAVLIGLLFLFMGMNCLIDPVQASANFFITPEGVAGLSTLRGDMAGMFLALGVFCLLGIRRGAQMWLYAAVVVLVLIAAGRLVGFALDGTSESTISAFAFELVFSGLLTISGMWLNTNST